MDNITKITEKLELNDVEVQDNNPCKAYWDDMHRSGQYDCNRDCYSNTSPYLTTHY